MSSSELDSLAIASTLLGEAEQEQKVSADTGE
jgi:hypothetical protein